MNRRNFISLATFSPFLGGKLFGEGFSSDVGLSDIYTTKDEWSSLILAREKLTKVKKIVGYGHFNVISFDEVLKIAKDDPKVGEFSKSELEFLDKLFYDNPNKYGFYGTQTTEKITQVIEEKEIIKINYTGHYLFRGKSLDDYNRILKDVGKDIILTSGIRSVPKQMSLYLDKIYSLNGNISQASRIIAPPAYTHHSISDFDVGKKGLGGRNFSTFFTTTQEFKSLVLLDYIKIRYTENNKDGVIYEPWHIQVV
ncbi:MAG: M15 family metallopeptidase [Arcobacteraceae bacterium]|nr:M15 family metallopeptidase [Arcobacteraceae bacterium]